MAGGIREAQVNTFQDENGTEEYAVSIQLTDAGAEELRNITSSHYGESIKIYLNDDMLSNPTINSIITDGHCQINASSYEVASEIVDLLNNSRE